MASSPARNSVVLGQLVLIEGSEFIDLGSGRVPVDLALAGRRSQLLGPRKLLPRSAVEPIEEDTKASALDAEAKLKMYSMDKSNDPLVLSLLTSLVTTAQSSARDASRLMAEERNESATSWVEAAFLALDVSRNGTLGPEDFDLKARPRRLIDCAQESAAPQAAAPTLLDDDDLGLPPPPMMLRKQMSTDMDAVVGGAFGSEVSPLTCVHHSFLLHFLKYIFIVTTFLFKDMIP